MLLYANMERMLGYSRVARDRTKIIALRD